MCVSRVLVWSLLTAYFQTELALNTHTIVVDIHQNILKTREYTGSRNLAVSGTRVLCTT